MPDEAATSKATADRQARERSLSADLGHLSWIAHDVLVHFKAASLAVLALNIVGTAAGAAAVGAIVLYARHLESGEPARLGGVTLELSRTTSGIIGFSTVLALLGLCSAACLYATQWLVGRMAVRYWRMCVQRLVNVAADPAYAGWGAIASGRPHRVLYELSGRTARMAAMVMRRMIMVILPLIVFTIAVTCLVIVSPLLTALLVPLMLAYLIPLYRIMRGVTRHQAQFLESNREAREGLREIIKDITGSSLTREQKMELAARSVQTPERDLTDELFSRRRLADDRMHLLNTAFFVLCVQVLFVYFAIQAGRNGHSWSELLLYIVALRFAVTELRRVTSALVFVSRLLPLIVPFYEFIRRAEGVKASMQSRGRQSDPLPDTMTIRCADEPMWNSESSLSIARGSILWVIQPWKPSHTDLQTIVRQLEWSLPQPVDLLSRTALHPACNGQPSGSTTNNGALQAGTWPHTHDMRVISAVELKGTGEHGVKEILDDRGVGYMVLVARNPRLALDADYKLVRDRVAGVVIMRDGRVLACGDLAWLKSNINPIRTALLARTGTVDDDGAEPDDDGDDDDEMDI